SARSRRPLFQSNDTASASLPVHAFQFVSSRKLSLVSSTASSPAVARSAYVPRVRATEAGPPWIWYDSHADSEVYCVWLAFQFAGSPGLSRYWPCAPAVSPADTQVP